MTLLEGGISSDPQFWGRKWRIIITLTDGTTLDDEGSTGLDVSTLRVVGTVSDSFVSTANPCELKIYNLNRETERLILSQGDKIYIEAGYQDPSLYGSIFSGTIYQTKRAKETSTDYTLSLRAMGNYDILSRGIIGFSIKRGTNYRELLNLIAQNSDPQLEVGEVPEGWGEDIEIAKGMAMAGKTKDVIKGISTTTNSVIKIEDNVINVIPLEQQPPTDEVIELNYTSGLLGQPTQTREGVEFQCLLNPHIKINSFVHINNAYINEVDIEYGDALTQNLDTDGLYRVTSRQFSFDTRGNNWYLNCQAVGQHGLLPDMLADGATRGI